MARQAPDPQLRPTWKVLGGGLIYAAWIGMAAVAAGVSMGAAAGLLTAAGIIGLALVGMRAIERESQVIRAVRAFFALRQTPNDARAWLRSERAALAELLDELRQWMSR